jgi:hypothetical protein
MDGIKSMGIKIIKDSSKYKGRNERKCVPQKISGYKIPEILKIQIPIGNEYKIKLLFILILVRL